MDRIEQKKHGTIAASMVAASTAVALAGAAIASSTTASAGVTGGFTSLSMVGTPVKFVLKSGSNN